MTWLPTLALLLTLSSVVFGIDEDSVKESKCFEVDKTQPLDTKWLESLKEIYYPAMSRLDLYRVAADLTGRDFKDIPEDELYYDGCLKWQMRSDGDFDLTGFNGVKVKYIMSIKEPENFTEFGFDAGESFKGHCSTTLTDNKTFYFLACCSNGNQMHWAVGSKEKTLPKATMKKIHAHAESLGFKKELFTSLRYDSCDKKGIKKE